MGEPYGAANEGVVLHEVAFYVEVAAAVEPLGLQVGSGELCGCSEIGAESALTVGGDERSGYAGGQFFVVYEVCFDVARLAIVGKNGRKLVVTHPTDECGGCAHVGECAYGVACRTARRTLLSKRRETTAHIGKALAVNKLHGTFWQFKFLKQLFAVYLHKRVNEGISDAQNLIHPIFFEFFCAKIRLFQN